MYTVFEYSNGGNPYITTTNEKLFEMLCKYYTGQFDTNAFIITGKRHWIKKTREGKQQVLRYEAQEWQRNFDKFAYSWDEVAKWKTFFAEMGKKYGLLREFRRNGII